MDFPSTERHTFNLWDSTKTVSRKYIDLSLKYNYIHTSKLFFHGNAFRIKSITRLIIAMKSNSILDTIELSNWYIRDSDCPDEPRSFISGRNLNKEWADNYCGSFVVADLNFDGREDVAVFYDFPNMGAIYKFFIQTLDGKYRVQKFLSDSIGFFPSEFDKRNKILEFNARSGLCGVVTKKYKYMDRSIEYKIISDKYTRICK